MEATFIAFGNTLDLFFTSEIARVGDVRILSPFPRCGHSPLVCEYLFSFDIDADEHIVKERYLWHRGDYGSLLRALLRVDWEMELMHLTADAAYDVSLQILSDLVNVYIPQCSRLHKLPWSVNPPAALKLAKADAWKSYKDLRASHGRQSCFALAALVEFNRVNDQFRHFVKDSRAEYEKRLIKDYSVAPKLFHSYIRKKKKGRMAVGPLRMPSGELTDSLNDMAELCHFLCLGVR